MDPIRYGKQSIDQSDIDAVVEALSSDFLTQGPRVLEFENHFSSYVGAKYAVAVSNCTAALHLSLMALGIKENDEVIIPDLTFVADANAVLACNAKPVVADINKENLKDVPFYYKKKK